MTPEKLVDSLGNYLDTLVTKDWVVPDETPDDPDNVVKYNKVKVVYHRQGNNVHSMSINPKSPCIEISDK